MASGASRWTMESKHSRPAVAPSPTTAASAAAETRPPTQSRASALRATTTSDPNRMRSSGTRRRSQGARVAPAKAPRALAATTSPNHQAGASSARRAKATRNDRNPTTARSTAMALAASRIPAPRSSARSADVAGAAATRVRGMREAATVAATNTRVASPRTHDGPSWSRATPGTAASSPTMPLIRTSLELASTSWDSSRTRPGTRDARATW